MSTPDTEGQEQQILICVFPNTRRHYFRIIISHYYKNTGFTGITGRKKNHTLYQTNETEVDYFLIIFSTSLLKSVVTAQT